MLCLLDLALVACPSQLLKYWRKDSCTSVYVLFPLNFGTFFKGFAGLLPFFTQRIPFAMSTNLGFETPPEKLILSPGVGGQANHFYFGLGSFFSLAPGTERGGIQARGWWSQAPSLMEPGPSRKIPTRLRRWWSRLRQGWSRVRLRQGAQPQTTRTSDQGHDPFDIS